MDSTVKACILSSLLGLTAAATLRADPGPDCWIKDKYCDTKDTEFTVFPLTDPLKDDAEECYEECLAQKDLTAPDKPCLGFTLNTFRNQPQCQLQKQECQDYIADDCFTNGKCKSGPSDCTSFVPGASNCPALPAISADYARWQCKDINFQTMNPYAVEGSPPDTVCTQMCPSWKSTDGSIAQLRSECVMDGSTGLSAWSDTETLNGETLEYPPLPVGQPTYPKPDAADVDALPCGCQPLDIEWPDIDTGVSFYYDPNLEEAAEFICTTDVVVSDAAEYILASDNTCVLYCDEHYVATATCVDGEWTGNPEWGFWCYNEPQIEDEVTAPPPV